MKGGQGMRGMDVKWRRRGRLGCGRDGARAEAAQAKKGSAACDGRSPGRSAGPVGWPKQCAACGAAVISRGRQGRDLVKKQLVPWAGVDPPLDWLRALSGHFSLPLLSVSKAIQTRRAPPSLQAKLKRAPILGPALVVPNVQWDGRKGGDQSSPAKAAEQTCSIYSTDESYSDHNVSSGVPRSCRWPYEQLQS